MVAGEDTAEQGRRHGETTPGRRPEKSVCLSSASKGTGEYWTRDLNHVPRVHGCRGSWHSQILTVLSANAGIRSGVPGQQYPKDNNSNRE